MRSQRKEFRCDPTSTADAGGSPDPPLFTDYYPGVPARGRGVRPVFRDLAGPAARRTHPAVPVVPDPREEGIAIHTGADRLRTAVPVYPHVASESFSRAHPVSPAREETAADLEPRGSEGAARSS